MADKRETTAEFYVIDALMQLWAEDETNSPDQAMNDLEKAVARLRADPTRMKMAVNAYLKSARAEGGPTHASVEIEVPEGKSVGDVLAELDVDELLRKSGHR